MCRISRPKPHFVHRVLQESLYGYHSSASASTNHTQNVSPIDSTIPVVVPVDSIRIDTELQRALRISIREQEARQEELIREQQLLEEVLRLSLEEKWRAHPHLLFIQEKKNTTYNIYIYIMIRKWKRQNAVIISTTINVCVYIQLKCIRQKKWSIQTIFVFSKCYIQNLYMCVEVIEEEKCYF